MRGRTWQAAGLVLFIASLLGIGVLLWRLRPAYDARMASRIKPVDDFNDGTEANLIGGEPFAHVESGAELNPALLRVRTPSPGGQLALALTYNVLPHSGASWGTGLNELDISAAKTLRFWIMAGRLPLPELSIELTDSFGRSARAPLTHLHGTTRWQRVVMPTRAFHDVNLNRLSRVTLHIENSGEAPSQGTLYVDDIMFVGPAQLFFRSLEDNLFGFPARAVVKPNRLLSLPDTEMLRAIAGDTWGFFRDAVDSRHHLPMNYIQTKPTRLIGDYASTTDISMYLLSIVSAHDLDLLDYPTAVARVRGTLERLSALPTWKHLFYNYYSTTNLQVTNQYISSVDNAWLAAALIVIRQAFPELAALSNSLLDPMDFEIFYDPQNGQIRLGYEADKERFAPYHYGLLATEARIISLVAIGKGDLKDDHWFRIYRTLPKEWTWQRQEPKGDYRRYHGHDVFQGYYVYNMGETDVPIVPSWGGSLFEFLMPTLVIDEKGLAPNGLGLNDQRAVDIHIHYALKERGLPAWGMSPCATPKERHGGYSEFGVAALGSKGYKDEATVTPHVTFLSLLFAPEASAENVRQMLRRFDVYGPYGLYDSVDVQSGDVAYRYLALDQGMSLVALNNYLNNGAIQRRFAADRVMKRIEPLLKAEDFFSAVSSSVLQRVDEPAPSAP